MFGLRGKLQFNCVPITFLSKMRLAWIILLFISVSSISSNELVPLCCRNVLKNAFNEYSELLSCVNSTKSEVEDGIVYGPTLSIVVLTRATKEIYPYAAYSYFLQHQYATSHGYSLLPLISDSSTSDYRYHRKIVPLLEAMDTYKYADYFVWMDSDLIVLDFSLSIEEIASQYDHAHILLSQDVSNLVNTGCIIVRNTIWSRKFLQEWLQLKSNRHILNEQIGFDHLFQLYKERDSQQGTSIIKRIAILPPETLNSIFPAMREQLPHHKVLHMATDSEQYRQTVFKTAAQNYCKALQKNEKVPHQLGISRKFLQNTVVSINRKSYEVIEEQIRALDPSTDADSPLNELVTSYRDSISKYCYAITYQNDNQETKETLNLRKQAFQTVKNVVEVRLQAVNHYLISYSSAFVNNVVQIGVNGISPRDDSLLSLALNEELIDSLQYLKNHVAKIRNGLKLRREQLEAVNIATAAYSVVPDLAKAAVELAFELLQSIAKMGNDYRSFGYSPTMIREEQTFLLEYILHTLEVMLITVDPKMLPTVEAMKSDFIVKCGDYCKNR